jgi:hypothetical protein
MYTMNIIDGLAVSPYRWYQITHVQIIVEIAM